jgi:hypothetical protein
VGAKDELLAAIDREQALIGRRAQLGAQAEDVDRSVSPPPPSTASEKVALFRGLFRGRDDVFAKLWVGERPRRARHPSR